MVVRLVFILTLPSAPEGDGFRHVSLLPPLSLSTMERERGFRGVLKE